MLRVAAATCAIFAKKGAASAWTVFGCGDSEAATRMRRLGYVGVTATAHPSRHIRVVAESREFVSTADPRLQNP